MANPGITATFSDLPTEMKANVFGYLRQNHDKRAVCLVSRTWKDIMAPMLWEVFKLRAASSLPGDLAYLLSPSNGVLAHVRTLSIHTDPGCINVFDTFPDFRIAVQLIIGALPRNCLSNVRFEFSIGMPILLGLLQSQQALETLQLRKLFPTEGSAIDSRLATHDSWITPTLRNIRRLQILGNKEDNNTYANSAYLLKNTPKLKVLVLHGFSTSHSLHDSYGNDAFGGPGQAVQALRLNYLKLQALSLRTYPASLFTSIDVSVLRGLCIVQCRKIGAFLTALVAGVSRVPDLRRLKILVHGSSSLSNAVVQAIEALVISASSLEKLLEQAPKLVNLAVNICPVDLGHVQYLGAKFKLFRQTDGKYLLGETESLLSRAVSRNIEISKYYEYSQHPALITA
ncbi:hypothetical protein G6011_00117 [Alternaria panax]|uniref:F-box domain-containing protein n=1 Tax=Alternaria panax TaxID=48097 RepID=A0AAD4IHM3_9PLEO|nr:hypothetical protein G6011_00117 [Alternaria panax]